MAKTNQTLIEIQFPPAPKVSDRPEKQEAFEKWMFDYNTCIRRQFEELAAKIDGKQNAT